MTRLKDARADRPTIIAGAALVVATAALVAAVGGFAGAAPQTVVRRVVAHKGKVHSRDIAPGAVTARALAHGAVSAGKIRKGAVGARKIRNGAVTAPKIAAAAVGPEAIAADAVTAAAIAPGSVYGGALGTETVVTKPIADLDAVASNIEWTASNTEAALCGPGERLLGAGFAFTNPGTREAAWLQAMPFVSAESNGVAGRTTTNSGGSATAEVAAICLR
jgi:hypothetical protein